MQLNFYSCLMAMIASTSMIIVIYFLKKTKYFSNAFGVAFMGVLYLLSFIRLLVPYELPAVQILLGDKIVLPKIMDVLENRSSLTNHLPHKAMYIIGVVSVWVTIALLLLLLIRQLVFVISIYKTKNHATESEQKMLSEISRKVFGRRTMMKLIKCDEVVVPMVVGVLKSTVIIPNREYSVDELELVLYHECAHLKNHDLWLKLLVYIYCCVFWFNPFVYLLKSDIDFILEIKCDSTVCKFLSEEKTLDYAKLINNNARNGYKKNKRAYLMTAGFESTNDSRHICRMNSILNLKSKNRKLPTLIVSLIMVMICVLSYIVMWQPDYSDNFESSVIMVVKSENGSGDEKLNHRGAYLVPSDDDNYIFCYSKGKAIVNKKDIEKGYYKGYPVIEKKFDESVFRKQ